MSEKSNVEAGDCISYEQEFLLPITSTQSMDTGHRSSYFIRPSPFLSAHRRIGSPNPVYTFLAGVVACLAAQFIIFGPNSLQWGNTNLECRTPVAITNNNFALPWAGSNEIHDFPPTSPTNVHPSYFPTDVGYGGPTPTGAEPAVIATAPAYPMHTGAAQLVLPDSLGDRSSKKFDLFKHWGNLSPWYSVGRNAFGLDSGPEPPETCRVTGLHFLHRHGARYPTSRGAYGGPAEFSERLNDVAEKWKASGDLGFLNEWTYKLGKELLTPFGRQQLFDLGVSMRLKYGFLLKNFTEANALPVFRTESQDRMLASARNFAIGFFGYPFEHQYQQSVMIEGQGFNNTLAPSHTCPNSKDRRGDYFVQKWTEIYLKEALARLQLSLRGYDLTIEDAYAMQEMCAYETVAIGFSKFCELFTEKEWEGFNYALELSFWYDSAFGSPTARALGTGWVQELVARLTHTPIETHNTSTNSTLNDNPITFPLEQSLYVDATHEVVILNIITALNLTNLAASGPLPYDHIPKERSFKLSELVPFATNIQFQLLECTSVPGPQIRVIINDGVTPLTGIRGCPKQADGMCSVDTFVAAQKEIIAETNWNYTCHGDWTVPEGPAWNTTTGTPPK